MKARDLHALSVTELQRRLLQCQQELKAAHEGVWQGKEKNIRVVRALRRDYARVATILQQKQERT